MQYLLFHTLELIRYLLQLAPTITRILHGYLRAFAAQQHLRLSPYLHSIRSTYLSQSIHISTLHSKTGMLKGVQLLILSFRTVEQFSFLIRDD